MTEQFHSTEDITHQLTEYLQAEEQGQDSEAHIIVEHAKDVVDSPSDAEDKDHQSNELDEQSGPSDDISDDDSNADDDIDDAIEDDLNLDVDPDRFKMAKLTVRVGEEDLVVTGQELLNDYRGRANIIQNQQKNNAKRDELKAYEQVMTSHHEKNLHTAISKLNYLNDVVEKEGGWEQVNLNHPPEVVDKFRNEYQHLQNLAKSEQDALSQLNNIKQKQSERAVEEAIESISSDTPNFDLDAQIRYLEKNGIDQNYALNHMQNRAAWDMAHKAMLYDQAQEKSASLSKKQSANKIKSRKHKSASATKKQPETRSHRLEKAINKQASTFGSDNTAATREALAELFQDGE